MAEIYQWRDHARISAGSRAAKAVSKSAVRPASRARSVVSKPAQYSAGILRLCHHLETCAAEIWGAKVHAPDRSAAIAMREPWEVPQSSMTSRKDVKLGMSTALGQLVLKSKPFVSLDGGNRLGHTVRMPDAETEDQYKQSFMKRVAAARAGLGWTQWQMADALGIPQDKYKQYESRSLLPHRLMPRFCLIARVDVEWLVSGRGKMASQPLPEAAPDVRPAEVQQPRKRRARAPKVA